MALCYSRASWSPWGQGKHGSETTRQVWGLQPKGGKFGTESIKNQQMGCASRRTREREFRGVTQVVKPRSRPRVSNTNQSAATDVNSSARTTTEEQTTSAARISRWENILTQVTLIPGFLLPKTCLYFSLYPEDITGPQKGESPFLVTSVFLLSVLYLSRES